MRNLLFVIIIFLNFYSSAQNYNIKINVQGIADSVAILGYHFGKAKYVTDTIKINKKGEGVFKGRKSLSHGMYFVLFPKRNSYFDIIIDNDQNFSLKTDTANNYRENLEFKGSNINNEFFKFNNKLENLTAQFIKVSSEINNTVSGKERTALQEEIKNLEKQRNSIILNTYNNTTNLTFKSIVGLFIDVEIPEIKIANNIANKDSAKQMQTYFYYKNHFFDYVNFNNSAIVRTPVFIPKFEKYISNIVIQHPDSIAKEAIILIEKSRGNKDLFSYLISYMLVYNEKNKQMGMDKVFVEIAKKYYATNEVTWVDSSYKAKVISKMRKTEPNLIGNYAPDIRNVLTVDSTKISLSKLKHDFIILLFWSPSCGHCKTTIPKLYNVYNELLNEGVDIEVFAVLEDKKIKKWKEFISEKRIIKWINVYDFDMHTHFHYFYDIFATPVIYILDKNKKIIAKRLNTEQVKEFIKTRIK